jgi:hypothetical protein
MAIIPAPQRIKRVQREGVCTNKEREVKEIARINKKLCFVTMANTGDDFG